MEIKEQHAIATALVTVLIIGMGVIAYGLFST